MLEHRYSLNLTAAAPSARPDRAQDNQKDDRADRRLDDHAGEAAPDVDVEARQQPVADQRPDNADRSVTDKSETIAAQDLADQPSGEPADSQDDEHALIRNMQ